MKWNLTLLLLLAVSLTGCGFTDALGITELKPFEEMKEEKYIDPETGEMKIRKVIVEKQERTWGPTTRTVAALVGDNLPGPWGNLLKFGLLAGGAALGWSRRKNVILNKGKEKVAAVAMEIINRIKVRISELSQTDDWHIEDLPKMINTLIKEEANSLKQELKDPALFEKVLRHVNEILATPEPTTLVEKAKAPISTVKDLGGMITKIIPGLLKSGNTPK